MEVVYLEKLMAEVLDQKPELREKFLKQWIEEAGIRTDRYQKIIFDYMQENYPDNLDLVMKTMEGINLTELHTDKSNSLVDLVSESSKMVIAPMPNLYFTRDPFASIGNGVSINRMYSVTRNRETIYAEYIFGNHPDFADVPEYYSRYNTFHIEGGDILNINDKVLAIGISQRTEPDAIDAIAKNIFEDETSPVETILAFNIPNNRAMMHLDTVFTQIDVDKFTIHPGIMGPLTVFEITAEGDGIKVKEMSGKLEDILEKYVGNPVELIPCGGGDRIAAEREQWNDGSNTLCIAPGTIVVYERNDDERAAQGEGPQGSRDALRRAVSRPWRPALHEHAACARGLRYQARAQLHAHECYESYPCLFRIAGAVQRGPGVRKGADGNLALSAGAYFVLFCKQR